MGVLVRELAALYAALRRRPAVAACPSCRSSTPTSPSGSAAGSGRGAGARSSPGGASGSPARRRSWSCPTDRPRPRGAEPAAARASPVAPGRGAARRRPGRSRAREGATLFMILLAGFEALLARSTGQDGRGRRHARRRPQPRGDRGADRLLRQHPGAARRPPRRARSSAAAGAGAPRDGPGRLRPPGPAVREAGGGAAAAARPRPARRCSR